jgi:ABC-type transporter Mla MlaB component
MVGNEYKIVLEKVSGGKEELVLEGDLLIDNVSKIYDELLSLAGQPEMKSIRIRNVSNIDLAVLQVLAAFAKSQKQKGRNIEFAFELDDQLSKLLDHAGIFDMLKSVALN